MSKAKASRHSPCFLIVEREDIKKVIRQEGKCFVGRMTQLSRNRVQELRLAGLRRLFIGSVA